MPLSCGDGAVDVCNSESEGHLTESSQGTSPERSSLAATVRPARAKKRPRPFRNDKVSCIPPFEADATRHSSDRLKMSGASAAGGDATRSPVDTDKTAQTTALPQKRLSLATSGGAAPLVPSSPKGRLPPLHGGASQPSSPIMIHRRGTYSYAERKADTKVLAGGTWSHSMDANSAFSPMEKAALPLSKSSTDPANDSTCSSTDVMSTTSRPSSSRRSSRRVSFTGDSELLRGRTTSPPKDATADTPAGEVSATSGAAQPLLRAPGEYMFSGEEPTFAFSIFSGATKDSSTAADGKAPQAGRGTRDDRPATFRSEAARVPRPEVKEEGMNFEGLLARWLNCDADGKKVGDTNREHNREGAGDNCEDLRRERGGGGRMVDHTVTEQMPPLQCDVLGALELQQSSSMLSDYFMKNADETNVTTINPVAPSLATPDTTDPLTCDPSTVLFDDTLLHEMVESETFHSDDSKEEFTDCDGDGEDAREGVREREQPLSTSDILSAISLNSGSLLQNVNSFSAGATHQTPDRRYIPAHQRLVTTVLEESSPPPPAEVSSPLPSDSRLLRLAADTVDAITASRGEGTARARLYAPPQPELPKVDRPYIRATLRPGLDKGVDVLTDPVDLVPDSDEEILEDGTWGAGEVCDRGTPHRNSRISKRRANVIVLFMQNMDY
ncbi:hypothetical protein STCU_10042 [Strigomonas culicis]|uniref:Proteophosphoglycan ppg4 n=1 Tax=Strigomonas culicis TaxID=28005 RepID=S9TPJ1_9TRYP|nr:hypothetical protein STCU_10042 [Strigomonas culicis]|eukprot:EPY18373.1 hypothetical protein STCU_10042 [Strigomonas culicis]